MTHIHRHGVTEKGTILNLPFTIFIKKQLPDRKIQNLTVQITKPTNGYGWEKVPLTSDPDNIHS
jgi:hypothetical protein